MDWKVPFVIYRITPDGKLEEVFHAADFKAASYWLSYIAEPGDVLCNTPLHSKHSHSSKKAEYWSHKGQGRELVTDPDAFKDVMAEKHFCGDFPEEQCKEQV
jgi:hypothetical protein